MDDRKYLENLLLDIDVLNELNVYTNDINLFDILKISNAELKHSIVLSYIFTPNESHNLGTKPLELFFKMLSVNKQIDQLEVFDLLDIDYNDFNIIREYKNIDILIKSNKNKIAVCIENKIWTGEHDNQLNRYKEIIDEEYKDYMKIYLYLTPDGYEASDNENWANISYNDILEIIEKLNLDQVNSKVQMLIEDYKKIIRRKIMDDFELKELCNKIYRKHKKAFDLIYENKEDETYYLYSIINEYLNTNASKGILCYDEKNSTKNYLRFTTNNLNNIFPLHSQDTGEWKCKNSVFYEIIIGKVQIRLQIAFAYFGLDKKTRYEEASCYFSNLGLKTPNFIERNSYLAKNLNSLINIENITLNEEQDKKYIFEQLDKIILPILKKEEECYGTNK